MRIFSFFENSSRTYIEVSDEMWNLIDNAIAQYTAFHNLNIIARKGLFSDEVTIVALAIEKYSEKYNYPKMKEVVRFFNNTRSVAAMHLAKDWTVTIDQHNSIPLP